MFPRQLFHRYAGPGADHLGNQARADLEADQPPLGLGIGERLAGFVKGLFQGFDTAMLVGRESLRVRLAALLFPVRLAGPGQLLAQGEQALGEFALAAPLVLLYVPLAFRLGQALLQRLQGIVVDRQACLGIAAQGLALALAFGQLAAQALEALRRRRQADAHPRTGGVEDVDGLVRQLATRQVAGGQFGGGHHRVVAQVDTVAFLVNPGQATQDRHRLGNARLMQLHGLEAPGQRRVLLEILLVFGPGRRRDGAQLATCQGRL